MNIAFLCQHFNLIERGAEVFVREVSSRLQARGHHVAVLPSASHLSKSSAHIVISTNGRSDVFKAKLWCLRHSAKLIVPGQSGPGLDDRLNLYSFPNVFVSLSEFQNRWAKKINPFVPLSIIPNGVDTAKFNAQVPPYKVKLPPPVVLSVGALTEDKRHDLVIKAAARLGVSLLLVGRGVRDQALRAQGEHLLKDRFHLLSLPHSQVPSVYTCADVFTFPSVPWESFGIVILEAMASGLPVVATDDPIRREIVGPAGLLVDPMDTEKYAKALWTAIKTDWHHAPRAQAEKFTWDSISDHYSQLCQSIIS